MAVHNWVRCHWRNGRHDLHDLPLAWRETLESHLSRQRARTADLGVVRVASVDALELAWVECEVSLGAGDCGFTYRRARAIHALVRPTVQGGAWKRQEVESLLGQRYGEPVDRGLASQHVALSRLRFPEDASRALGLFVGRAEMLPSELEGQSGEPATLRTPEVESTTVARAASAAARPTPQPETHESEGDFDESNPELWFRRFKLIAPPAPRTAEPRLVVDTDAAADGDTDAGVETDEHDEQTRPLFDLSLPSAHRPPAPPSALSGLLGPSHTAVW